MPAYERFKNLNVDALRGAIIVTTVADVIIHTNPTVAIPQTEIIAPRLLSEKLADDSLQTGYCNRYRAG